MLASKDSSQLSTKVVKNESCQCLVCLLLPQAYLHTYLLPHVHTDAHQEGLGTCTGYAHLYLNTTTCATPSTYMSTVYAQALLSRWTLSLPMYLRIDTWAYSLIQVHTHPDAWAVSPVVSHGFTLTLFRADLGAVLTPQRICSLSPC